MQLSQYLCTSCGSVLKETAEYVEIHSLREECPQCGSFLADSLTRRALRLQMRIKPPEIQRADSLLKLKFDIPKIDSFIGFGAKDLCCISGHDANLLMTRLCIRSLLPERHGGLNSPYVMVADLGNRTDVYGAINLARQYGLNKQDAADRILVVRAFTVHQVTRLLSVELPRIVQKYRLRSIFVPGLLNAFDEDPNMRMRDVKMEIAKITKAITELSTRVLVVTGVSEGRHSGLVLPMFKKHINIVQENSGRLSAELYNQGDNRTISLTERELKIISRN